jgi:hypothetical protein
MPWPSTYIRATISPRQAKESHSHGVAAEGPADMKLATEDNEAGRAQKRALNSAGGLVGL